MRGAPTAPCASALPQAKKAGSQSKVDALKKRLIKLEVRRSLLLMMHAPCTRMYHHQTGSLPTCQFGSLQTGPSAFGLTRVET
eukprot:2027663-Pleurochrysis_carterae.AAC.6